MKNVNVNDRYRHNPRLISAKSAQRTLLVLLFAGISFFSIRAQAILTIEDAIALALQNNYDIQLSRQDSNVAALDYEYRNAVFLPRINATLGTVWTNNSQRQEFVNSDNNRSGNVATNNVSASVNLNWTLFDGFKMFTTRTKAEEYIHLGELIIKEQVVNTVADVVKTYYQIVKEKQQLKAIEEQMSISQTRVDLAQRKLDIGMGTKPEVLQSLVDLNAQKAAALQQETILVQLKEKLNLFITPANYYGNAIAPYDVTDSIPVNFDLTLEAMQAEVNDLNPSLQIARKNIDLSYLNLKQIKADRLPIVQFNSAYNFSRTSNDVALNQFLPIFNRNSGFNYGFTASIPILNYRNTQRLIRQEELNIGFQRLYLSNQQSLLQLQVMNAFQDFDFQKRALQLEESNISLAKENMNIILETYRLGSATYLQLREAQKSLEDAYNRLIAARYNTKIAEVEMLRIRGTLVQ